MIDLDLISPDGPTRVSRLMHSGRGLLLTLDGTPRSIDRWADRVDHVTAKAHGQADAVLIRPDGYIALISDAGDVSALTDSLAGFRTRG